jgi:hypothetical protein
MNFTKREKELALQLKQTGITWNPQEGDWFWCKENLSHHFYLGESLPASYSFQQGEAYVFDSGMTWHVQQGGLSLSNFVWLPTWEQCRRLLKEKGGVIALKEENGQICLEAFFLGEKIGAKADTDLEAMYEILLKAFQK